MSNIIPNKIGPYKIQVWRRPAVSCEDKWCITALSESDRLFVHNDHSVSFFSTAKTENHHKVTEIRLLQLTYITAMEVLLYKMGIQVEEDRYHLY
ncbi:MAG: hypothetical protein HWN81_00045 [Candidatus Lokiarchaeota archaeon]|nr:hypothetical protein [Candidatus Lokiarchaeota archaeon]